MSRSVPLLRGVDATARGPSIVLAWRGRADCADILVAVVDMGDAEPRVLIETRWRPRRVRPLQLAPPFARAAAMLALVALVALAALPVPAPAGDASALEATSASGATPARNTPFGLRFIEAAAARVDDAISGLAGVFHARQAPPQLALRLDAPRAVDGFLTAHNLAPGDAVEGQLALSAAAPAGATLAIAIDLEETGPQPPSMANALRLLSMTYGDDELLSGRDGGLDLAGAWDVDRDGRVSLWEARGGTASLPPPAPAESGGTVFHVRVVFAPGAVDGGAFADKALRAAFVFTLTDGGAV